jgi:hypothetical protein
MDFGAVGQYRGSVAHVDKLCSAVIAHNRAVGVTNEACKRDMALVWLRQQRPAQLWPRLAWAWGIARRLLRAF